MQGRKGKRGEADAGLRERNARDERGKGRNGKGAGRERKDRKNMLNRVKIYERDDTREKGS